MTRKLTLPVRMFSVLALLLSATLIVTAQNPVPFINQPLVPDAIAPGAAATTPFPYGQKNRTGWKGEAYSLDVYMLLRFQKAAVRGNYETGNQAFSKRLRFLTIRDVLWCRFRDQKGNSG